MWRFQIFEYVLQILRFSLQPDFMNSTESYFAMKKSAIWGYAKNMFLDFKLLKMKTICIKELKLEIKSQTK